MRIPFQQQEFHVCKKDREKPYRYRINTYSIGGPIFIPGKFNTAKEKLFFFWSQEYTGIKKDYGERFSNMPTQLERDGDYSRSFDGSGVQIKVNDPLNLDAQGKAIQFPGNVIPKARFNAMGLKILNFPIPNWVERSQAGHNRNYRAQNSGSYPAPGHVPR
jgi:hypothetical protein